MKNTSVLLLCLWVSLLSAQTNLLKEVQVNDSLLPLLSIGHHVYQVDAQKSNGDVGQQLAGKSPVVINQAAPNLLAGYYMRGSYSDGVQIFWNGMPVNSPTLGLTDLNLLNPASFNQILVLPGGSGAELGSGAVGGSIFLDNILSAKAKNGQTLRLGGGANGYKNMSSKTIFGKAKAKVEVNLFYDAAENDYAFLDGFNEPQKRVNNAYERYGISANGIFIIGNTRLKTNALVQDFYREIPAPSSGINASFPASAWQTDKVYRIQNVLSWKTWHFEQGINVENQIYSNKNSKVYSTNNFAQYSSEVRKTFLATNKFNWQAGAYLNAYTANGTNVNQNQNEYGLRTDFTHRITRKWLYKVSVSADFIDDRFAKQLDTTGYGIPFLPSFSTQYFLNRFFKLRASVSEVFNNPTLNERFWPEAGVEDIQPERGLSAEIGTDYSFSRGGFSSEIHLTAFYTKLQNRIRWISAVGSLYGPQNVTESESKGIEFAQDMQYKKYGWKLELNYNFTYNQALVIRDNALGSISEGMQLINIPLLIGGAQFNASYSKVSFYLSTQFSSGAFTTSDNDPFLKVAPYTIGNAGINYKFELGKFTILPQLHVLNITDVQYQTLNFQPMPGTQLFLNFTFNYQI